MKIVALSSGGLDSSVLCASLQADGHEVFPIAIGYGQKHSKELASSLMVAKHLELEHTSVYLPDLAKVMKGSSQTDDIDVPHGHYSHENMVVTVVPNRNMILVAVAAAHAISLKAYTVAYAAHSGDHAIYPDCRPQFYSSLDKTLQECFFKPVRLRAPFMHMSKAEIVQLGTQLNFPFELTWSCYEGANRPCGRCGTCVERLEAFAIAGVEDPLSYEDRSFWKEAVRGV